MSKEKQERIKNRQTGSVMVVGAGISGIQASIDLADSGYKVYLIEKAPSIGGGMTQLDKTFPTNDCSMCIVSPKLVEASRHINIELLTYSEVEEITGEAGSFNIKVRKKARSVIPDKCTGCGICMNACPVQQIIHIPEKFDEKPSKEIKEADAIIDRYGGERRNMIQILQEANNAFNYLPEAVLRRISMRLRIPFAEVYGTASFFKSFSLKPRGKHIIRVCMGTACHIRGAQRLFNEFQRKLNITSGQTTEDRMFTLERVNCLGACALGPIVDIDGNFHSQISPAGVTKLLNQYKEKETT